MLKVFFYIFFEKNSFRNRKYLNYLAKSEVLATSYGQCKPRHWNLGIGIGTGIGTDIANAIISTSVKSMDSKLAVWWLMMRRPHPQNHVTLEYRGHMTNKKRFIYTFTRSIEPMWSPDKRKTLYFHIRKAHGPKNLTRYWLRMRKLREDRWHFHPAINWQF